MQDQVVTTERPNQFSEKLRQELEKLTGSINEIMRNIRMMQNPIAESREKLPIANDQLDKVSAQTEKATHRMLDMVEQIIAHQEKIVQFADHLAGFFNRSRARDRDLCREQVDHIREIAAVSQDNAFLIMDALQFQDITAQQMQHASTLLMDIELRMRQLMAAFEGREVPELEARISKALAYDPDADLFNGRDQREVDAIVSGITAKK